MAQRVSPSTAPRNVSTSDVEFSEALETTGAGVRAATRALLEACAPGSATAAELVRILGLDRKLAWKFRRLVDASGPLETFTFLPGDAAFDILFKAARRRGVSPHIIEKVRDALQEYQAEVMRHAGDKDSLALLLASRANLGTSAVALAHRRAAFQGNTFLWGIQAAVQYKLSVFWSAAQSPLVDCAAVRGFVGMRRFRAKVRWPLFRVRAVDAEGGVLPAGAEALDPRVSRTQVPLLLDFCSDPPPCFERIVTANGIAEEHLAEGSVGNLGAVTFFAGEIMRAVGSRYASGDDRYAATIMSLHTPAEYLVLDLLVERGLFGPAKPEFCLFSEMGNQPWPASGEHTRLPIEVPVEPVLGGTAALANPLAPELPALAQYALNRIGMREAQFDIYRVSMPFPPIPTTSVLRFPLFEPPNS